VLREAPLENRIEGVVQDQRESPVGGARVQLADAGRSVVGGTASTEEDGSFAFLAAANRQYALRVVDSSPNGWPDIRLSDIEPGTTDLVLVFHDTRPLRVRVPIRKEIPCAGFALR